MVHLIKNPSSAFLSSLFISQLLYSSLRMMLLLVTIFLLYQPLLILILTYAFIGTFVNNDGHNLHNYTPIFYQILLPLSLSFIELSCLLILLINFLLALYNFDHIFPY
jgi:hypothetical protein